MSDSKKKDCRTQGKYSDKSQYLSRDKRHKFSPTFREPPEKKIYKRYSNESKGLNTSLTEESLSPVKYEENSDYSFSQFEEAKKRVEVMDGRCVLSKTVNGESVILYVSQFLQNEEAFDFMERLYSTTCWYSKNIVIHGEEFPQPRLVAWYGPYPYSYSGTTLDPAEMPDLVIDIKNKIEEYLTENGINVTFNSVLLNLYRDGKDSVSWHSDDELTMGICPTIASVSLGETRKFEMRPKKKHYEDEIPCEKQEYFVHLTHGSLLIMDGSMQDDWQHRVPKEYHDKQSRINLTFRTVYPLEKVPHRVPAREFKKEHIVDSNSNKTPNCKIDFDDENFPPLNSNESPPTCSSFRNSTHERAQCSNLSWSSLSNNGNLNRLSENWDTETSSDNEQNLGNDMFVNKHNYDSNFPTEDVHSEKIINEDENSVEMSLDESPTNDSIDAAENMTEDVCLNEDKSLRKWKIEANDKKSPKKLNVKVSDREPQREWKVDANDEESRRKWKAKTNDNEPPKDWKVDGNNKEPVREWKVEANDREPSRELNVKSYDKKPSRQWNVEAKEFVPNITSSHTHYNPSSHNRNSQLCLEDLLHYKVDLMHGTKLSHHALLFKTKVLERLEEFKQCDREELEFLCDLTDGTQTDKNQKLITSRMRDIIINKLEINQPFNNRKSNHHTDRGRRYQNQRRGCIRRY